MLERILDDLTSMPRDDYNVVRRQPTKHGGITVYQRGDSLHNRVLHEEHAWETLGADEHVYLDGDYYMITDDSFSSIHSAEVFHAPDQYVRVGATTSAEDSRLAFVAERFNNTYRSTPRTDPATLKDGLRSIEDHVDDLRDALHGANA